MTTRDSSVDYHTLEAAEKNLHTQEQEVSPVDSASKPFRFAIQHVHVRECFSEFLSTFMYVAFGLGVAAQATLSKGAAGYFTSVTIAWGIGVMLGMHVGGGVSHSHMNPAITLALACVGVFPWKKVPGYVVSQTLGAFTASLMVYVMFYQLLHVADPMQTKATATIFHTHPHPSVNHSAAFLAELLATMVLLIGILALIDEKNRSTTVASFPSCVGVLVIGIGMAFSLISSAALNPARDVGPRIMLSMVGYDGVFSADGYYFWVPLVAPVVGAVVGVYVYLLFVMGHHPAKVERHGFF